LQAKDSVRRFIVDESALMDLFRYQCILGKHNPCKIKYIMSRVSNPHLFNADPDPTFFLIADPDPGFDDLKLKKNYS
jgi:hypothetical protein